MMAPKPLAFPNIFAGKSRLKHASSTGFPPMLENAARVLGTCIPLLRGGARSLDDGIQAPRIPEYLCREVTTVAREDHLG